MDIEEALRGAWDSDDYLQSPMYQVHVKGSENLAIACKEQGLALIHIDTVYSHNREIPFPRKYIEDDKPDSDPTSNPTLYGLTHAIARKRVLEIYSEGVVVLCVDQVQTPNSGLFTATLRSLTKGPPNKFTRSKDFYAAPITDITLANVIHNVEKAMHEG